MADVNNTPAGVPDGCTHNCNTCNLACDSSKNGEYGKLWKAIDDFSQIDSDDLLKMLNSVGEEDK